MLEKAIKSTIGSLKCDITEICTLEVKNALERNFKALEDAVQKYEDYHTKMIDRTKNLYSLANEEIGTHLAEYRREKREFFRFNTIKECFFWISQATSIGTFVLLIYFLFFK